MKIDFKEKKDCIFMMLVNLEAYAEILMVSPHIPVFDMAITYRFLMHKGDDGIDTVLITDSLMNEIGLTHRELHDLAMDNTRRLFPPRLLEAEDGGIYCTNEHQSCGAGVLLYQDFMDEVAEKIGDEFYIIPVSVHDVMAVPSGEFHEEAMLHMLADINENRMDDRENLSKCLLRYNSKEQSMRRVASYSFRNEATATPTALN